MFSKYCIALCLAFCFFTQIA